jgi:hypothetical protein
MKLGGVLVFVGVALEITIAALHPLYDSWLEQWGSAFCNGLVAAGVAIEIQFNGMGHRRDKELDRRTKKQLADAIAETGRANKLAGEANERAAEIERFTAFRRISHDQLNMIQASLTELRGKINLLVECQMGDTEAFVYARDLVVTFTDIASINLKTNSYPDMNAFGLFITSSPSLDIEIISKSFIDAGIEFSRMHKDLSTHLSPNLSAPNLYIFVAPKPPPPLTSPAIAKKVNKTTPDKREPSI